MWQLPFMPDMGSFPPGTHIQTNRGDVLVEDLTPGDRVITSEGENATVRRIGVRTVRFPQRLHACKPVLIRAGALGGGLPTRDLAVAPGARLAVGDVVPRDLLASADLLAPAAGLVGLVGVRRMKGRRKVRLYSIHLDVPKLIMAEGCMVESTPSLVSRAANRLTAGWSGVLAARLAGKGMPRALSVWQTRRWAGACRRSATCPTGCPAGGRTIFWNGTATWRRSARPRPRRRSRKRSKDRKIA